MQDALEIKDRKSLRSWLDDKPVEWAQLIALRAALRVFPLVIVKALKRPLRTRQEFRS
jgi:hypothetical protein